jgi:polysaccharide biosynthesis PFTS motif protein
MLLGEFAQAARIRLQPPGGLAAEYLFHSSDVVYRPCWTYEAENQGAGTAMYCYSTNSEPSVLPNGTTAPLHSWQVMTWSRVLVWDRWQAAFISNASAGRVQPIVVGPIWFHSSPAELSDIQARSIALFDVQPQRNSRRPALITPHTCYTPAAVQAFLSDVVVVAGELGRQVLFKRKRHAGPLVHRGYLRLVERLSVTGALSAIDPDISAVRVIDCSDVVISMPFTSTALLAREQGKHSVYYDPTGLIQPDDPAAHGVPVIRGIAQLRAWFRDLAEVTPGARAV